MSSHFHMSFVLCFNSDAVGVVIFIFVLPMDVFAQSGKDTISQFVFGIFWIKWSTTVAQYHSCLVTGIRLI